jgi:hypothetical protein
MSWNPQIFAVQFAGHEGYALSTFGSVKGLAWSITPVRAAVQAVRIGRGR